MGAASAQFTYIIFCHSEHGLGGRFYIFRFSLTLCPTAETDLIPLLILAGREDFETQAVGQ